MPMPVNTVLQYTDMGGRKPPRLNPLEPSANLASKRAERTAADA